MQRKAKRILSLVLCLILVFSMMSVGALATSYTAPTSGVVANDNILTGTGNRAGTTTLSILGINVTALGDTNGIYDGGGAESSDEYGTDSPNLGTFGSDNNDNPDPYLYNWFYNYNTTKSGGSTYSVDANSSWSATPYTLVGQPSSTITISVGGVTKTTNCYCFYEPDIHVVFGGGASGSPASAVAEYQAAYNADYDPVIINTVTTSSERTDGLGNAYNMFEMSANMTDVGLAADELAAELGKTTRYAESAAEIGSNYDKWSRGFYYWAQLMFEVYDGTLSDDEVAALEAYGVDIDALGGGLEKVRGVRSFAYDSDTDTWTIYDQTSRQTQYASGIIEDVYEVLAAEYAEQGESAAHQPFEYSSGRTTATAYSLTTAELIEYLNPEGQEHGGFLLDTSNSTNLAASDTSEGATMTVREQLEAEGIKVFSNLPTTVYGITMQARENALGQPYYLAYIYYDQLAAMTNVDMTLNPISLVFYWMSNFYHVNDTDAMQTVIVNMLENADLPSGLVVTDSATTDSYGSGVAEDIENMIILGMKYYLAVEEPRLIADGEEMSVSRDSTGATNSSGTNWAFWFSLRGGDYEGYDGEYDDVLSMGIGSDDIYLNPEGNGVANRYLNAQNYASDGTVDTFYTEYSSYIQEGTIVSGMTYGDINGDGSIDSADVVIVLRAVAGTLTLTSTQETYADVTGDGAVGVADAVMILQYIVGIVTSLT
ncbi:MAG: dockerin type I repeat-containing protein [Oscillospiraceae bacterium]|nr:dockerin type I repeat-containing protein [Oscillospiraceae bacterium]